jgi:predicted RNA binding protein YcfA (HicA-like mRNA interferase family)
MVGWKKIKKMVKSKSLGDVKFKELKNYLETEGYRLEKGSKHTRVMTRDGRRLSAIPKQKTIRVDQLRYILKQVGRL